MPTFLQAIKSEGTVFSSPTSHRPLKLKREMASPSTDVGLQTVAEKAPITAERKLNLNLQDQLPEPYLARALAAVDPTHPNGTEGRDHRNMSVLQQHAAFFDRNKDGIIYPWESYQGFRAIGCGVLLSIVGGFLINLAFGYVTQPGWIPNPLMPIYIKNIHKCKHGSDTETYDTEGRFAPSKFDAIFSKYAITKPDALSSQELSTMLRANRNLTDFNGWFLSFGEWKLFYFLAKDEEGYLHRESIRGIFDGSTFEQLEKNRQSRAKRS